MAIEIRSTVHGGTGDTVEELRDTAARREAELAALHAREAHARPGTPTPSAASPAAAGSDVLIELYEQKARASAAALVALQETATNLEAQLHALRAERDGWRRDVEQAGARAEQLAQQVGALREERDALQATLAAQAEEVEAIRRRAKAVVEAMLEKALA